MNTNVFTLLYDSVYTRICQNRIPCNKSRFLIGSKSENSRKIAVWSFLNLVEMYLQNLYFIVLFTLKPTQIQVKNNGSQLVEFTI